MVAPSIATSREPPSASPIARPGPASSMASGPVAFASDSDGGGGCGGGGDGAENASDACELVVWTTVALVIVIALTAPNDVCRLGNTSRSPELLFALDAMV